MAFSPAFTVNTQRFQATLRQYLKHTRRTLPEICNNKAYDLAGGFGRGALQKTKSASGRDIGRALSRKVTTETKVATRGRAKGKTYTRRLYEFDADTFASRIVNWRLRKQNKKMKWGDTLIKAAKALTAKRVRSAGFLKSGWLAAIRSMSPHVPGARVSQATAGVEPFRRNRFGFAKAALSGFKLKATVTNTSINPKKQPYSTNHSRGRILAIVKTGARRAVAAVQADMVGYIRRKLKGAGAKAGVKMR